MPSQPWLILQAKQGWPCLVFDWKTTWESKGCGIAGEIEKKISQKVMTNHFCSPAKKSKVMELQGNCMESQQNLHIYVENICILGSELLIGFLKYWPSSVKLPNAVKAGLLFLLHYVQFGHFPASRNPESILNLT